MAEVFAGHAIGDHGFQKPVAIKRLLPELASDHVFVERLIGEAKLLVGMAHGNIVSVMDLARDGDDVFLVMEYVDGPSLRQLLKARGVRGLSLGTASYIVQAAASGLEFAHSRPGGAIIHADISPSNLLLTTSGEVRVADFGIARREGGGYGPVEGKWAYMAPEQARGEPLTPRSDVFALGVVLYELLCGAHPFGRQVTHEERDSEPMRVIPPRVVKPTVPPGLDAICMRALAHDPRARYGRMQQLIDALVEERFTNQYREGASDLAQAIREVSPQPQPHVVMSPRTQITDRPVTIVTRSLIELTPARRPSSRGTPAPYLPDSGAHPTSRASSSEDLMRAAALLEIPPMLRADGTPLPPFRLSSATMQSDELASVVGGHTIPGIPGVASAEPRSNTRWTIAVLGIAALIGAIAAAVIQLTPAASDDRQSSSPPAITTRVAPVVNAAPPTIIDQPTITPAPEQTVETVSPVSPAIADGDSDLDPVSSEVVTKRPPRGNTTRPPKRPAAVASKKDNNDTREPGFLRVGGDQFAWVTVAGQVKESMYKITLPPGRYSVRLRNPKTGETLDRSVVIESNETSRIIPEWEEE